MKLNLHLISDSTGDTLMTLSRTILSQLPDIECQQFRWFLIRSENETQAILNSIRKNPGIVMYTVIPSYTEQEVIKLCQEMKIPYISTLSGFLYTFKKYLGITHNKETITREIKSNPMGDAYLERIEAINYTINHDDGASLDDLESADIILIGASRTSKTPTSIYLAYRGYKVANIPFISLETFPKIIFEVKRPLIIGLTIDPGRLESIRKTRISTLESESDTDYTEIESIREEISNSRKLFTKIPCPTINVTQKSVEETAVYIMKMLTQKLGR